MTLPFIICAAVTAISAMVSLGYSVAAALTNQGEAKTEGCETFCMTNHSAGS